MILSFHGDTPPWGYAVGWAAFSIKDPSGPPLYISKQPYLFPSKNVEKLVNVQVNKVIFNSAINVGPDGRVITYFGEGDTVIGTAVSQLVAPRAGDPQFTYSDCIKAMMKP
ncbi:MAG: hypothetical protein EOP09_19075 [Proteobacteria bacterium]|nr:MAG: hypothetical protein EOP09_19075 [Pseudomonadota bacterium]